MYLLGYLMGLLIGFDSPPSATEDVARLRLRARHRSLAELEAEEVVTWHRDEHIVRKGRRFYEMWDELFSGSTEDHALRN